jgi:hypothetical protein
MRDNLIAKFYNLIKTSTLSEFPNIKDIEFVVDKNIENPSNKDVIDCQSYYKEYSKKTKKLSQDSDL